MTLSNQAVLVLFNTDDVCYNTQVTTCDIIHITAQSNVQRPDELMYIIISKCKIIENLRLSVLYIMWHRVDWIVDQV